MAVEFRRTKIVCTLGPATDDPAVLRRLLEAGLDVARINLSHGTAADHRR
ncbi:MAG TPA: pyruvate kinase, partial [Thermaerobacter sp.]